VTIVKYNIPIITEGGIPNTNNLSDEMSTIQTLATKLTRSNVGQINYTSLSSGINYNTVDYISESDIYNKGETGLYNLLIKELDEYILQAKDLNEYGTGVITNTNWNLIGGAYKYEKYVPISGITSDNIVNLAIDSNDLDIAAKAYLSSANNSYDGGVIVYCNYIPTGNINFTYTVFK
jgi:hypothetical protein